MNASDVMTRGVITVSPDASIVDAARLMLQHRITGLPVVDSNGQLTGIMTKRDLLQRVGTGGEPQRVRWLEFLLGPGHLVIDYGSCHDRKVAEVMTPDPRTVCENAPLEEVVHQMGLHNVELIPVMRGKQLVGIIGRANLVRALASLAREALSAKVDDAAVRERVLAEFDRQPWKSIDVVVRNGEVELSGLIADERQRQTLKVAIENVPGVKAVHDHVASIDSVSARVSYSREDEEAGTAQQ
jgi:CBS domain-containing protein